MSVSSLEPTRDNVTNLQVLQLLKFTRTIFGIYALSLHADIFCSFFLNFVLYNVYFSVANIVYTALVQFHLFLKFNSNIFFSDYKRLLYKSDINNVNAIVYSGERDNPCLTHRFDEALFRYFFLLLFFSSYCPWSIDKPTGIRTQTGANIPRSDLTLTRGLIKTGTLFYISTFWTYLPLFVTIVFVCFGYQSGCRKWTR